MTVIYEDRVSDSPFVETIWRTQAISAGCDIVVADANWDMLIVQQEGKLHFSVAGPMTHAVPIPHAKYSAYLGIRFKLSANMPLMPIGSVLNSVNELPAATGKSFHMSGSKWEYPTYENVEVFINRLVRSGLLCRDEIVEATLEGDPQYISRRSVQRRFLQVTGLSQRYIYAIERARRAASLLKNGTAILDTVHHVGYADQQSMTKSLKRFIGLTPGQIAGIRESDNLSFQDNISP